MWLRRTRKEPDYSHEALKDARDNLQKTRDREQEVREVSQSLRTLRTRNHFTEKLRVIMIEGGAL